MKPWPKLKQGEVLWRSPDAEGVEEISPGLSRPATIPRLVRCQDSGTSKGYENGWGVLRRTILAPLQGAEHFSFVVRGYRCAQPPANVWHPFAMPERGFVSRSTLAAKGVLHALHNSVASEAAAGHRPALLSNKGARA